MVKRCANWPIPNKIKSARWSVESSWRSVWLLWRPSSLRWAMVRHHERWTLPGGNVIITCCCCCCCCCMLLSSIVIVVIFRNSNNDFILMIIAFVNRGLTYWPNGFVQMVHHGFLNWNVTFFGVYKSAYPISRPTQNFDDKIFGYI